MLATPMNRFLRCATLTVVAACLTLTTASSPARADGGETAFTNLIALVSQRLSLAEPVARYKWAHKQPITDAPREQALLADVEARAASAGVEPAFAREFFQDQIDASKDVQNALFDTWRKTRPPEGAAPDLATTLRPQLDKLTQSLIAAMARVQTLRTEDDCPTRVARSVDNWKTLTRYDSTRNAALNRALGHLCASGGVGATG